MYESSHLGNKSPNPDTNREHSKDVRNAEVQNMPITLDKYTNPNHSNRFGLPLAFTVLDFVVREI